MRRRIVLVVAIIIFVVFVASAVVAAQPTQPQLVNGGFEGAVVEWDQRVNVAQGWTPFYYPRESLIQGGASGNSSLPEYKPLTVQVDPYRVYEGNQSQCWFWFYTHGDAGVYQRVQVPAGNWRIEVKGQAWVSNRDDHPHDDEGEMYISLGIDPEGRDPGAFGWPWETSVVWSDFTLVPNRFETYSSRVVYVERDGWITVYIRTWKKWAEKHGDTYIDNAELINEGSAMTPIPTQTPQPTAPCPTPEPCATCPPDGSCSCASVEDVATVIAEWDRR